MLVDGPVSISEIGRRLSKTKQNMTFLIDSLLAVGLVQRLGDEHDRRVVRIAITPKGRAFLKDVRKKIKENVKKNVSHLSGSELGALCKSLENLARLIPKIIEGDKHGKNARKANATESSG